MRSIKEILTFKAFEPEIEDDHYPLRERFRGKCAVFANIGSVMAKTGLVRWDGAGKPVISDVDHFRRNGADNEITNLVAKVKKHSAAGVVLLVGSTGTAVIVNSAMHVSHAMLLSAMETRLGQVIGRDPLTDEAYIPVVNPVRDNTLVFSVQKPEISRLVTAVSGHEIRVARAGFPFAAIMDYLIRMEIDRVSGQRDLLILDPCGTFLLSFDSAEWVHVSCRTDVQAVASANFIERMLERDGSVKRGVDFISSVEFAFGEWAKEQFPSMPCHNIFPETPHADFWFAAQG